MDSHHPFYLPGLLSGKCPELFIKMLFWTVFVKEGLCLNTVIRVVQIG